MSCNSNRFQLTTIPECQPNAFLVHTDDGCRREPVFIEYPVNEGGITTGGNQTFQGNLTVQGNTALGNAVGDTLTVSGPATFQNNATITGNLIVQGNTLIGNANTDTVGFYGVAGVARPAANTAALTTITFTAPTTPDYAIAAPTSTTPFGFSTADEMSTTLSVIANLQARVTQLETKLQSLGLLT